MFRDVVKVYNGRVWLYGKLPGTSQGLTVATLLLVSMAGYSGMGTAMFASGPQLARERHNGWMRQLRISGLAVAPGEHRRLIGHEKA